MAKNILVCLHGWGASKESFTELRAALEGLDIEILTPNFPGCGEEVEPEKSFTNDDYAEWVINWLITDHESLITNHNWYLLGHSHGGRIAIKMITGKLQSTNYNLPSHLFLCASAGIRHPRHFRRIVGLILSKSGKCLLSIPGLKTLQPIAKKLLYTLVRVHDYEKASPVMQQTLINVTKEDLRPLLKKITVPTDLFWGTDDSMTPYSDAKLMEREISNATLHTFTGVRHRVHRDRAKEIGEVIRKKLQ